MLICIDGAVIRISLYGELWKINILILILNSLRWVERGWGVNILEDARHCSVLYIRKYFVSDRFSSFSNLSQYFFKIYLEKKNFFSQQLFSGLEQAEDKILMLMTNP